MDIRTSTPIVIPKNFGQDSRLSNISPQCNVNPQLYQTDKKSNYKTKINHESWYSKLDGPCFVDFQNGIPEPRDSFFDGRPSFCPTPTERGHQRVSLSTPEIDIVNSLKRWSISKIEDITEGDSTLKAPECTIREFQNSRNSTLSIGSDLQRRESRQSFTAVKPFSFELREKERQERKEAKLHYLNILHEQQKHGIFKAKPAPKFKNSKNANAVETNEKPKSQIQNKPSDIKKIPEKQKPEIFTGKVDLQKVTPKIIKKEKPQVSAKINEIIQIFDKPKPSDPTKIRRIIETKEKPKPLIKVTPAVSTVTDTESIHIEKIPLVEKKGDEDTHNKKQQIQPWKQKPFQVSLPRRKLCIARSPKLLTAQRARQRQLFDDKLKEKIKQYEEIKKTDATAKEHREKEEIHKLRKQLVHKAKPAPPINSNSAMVSKRALSNPLMPIFVKRRKLDKAPK